MTTSSALRPKAVDASTATLRYDVGESIAVLEQEISTLARQQKEESTEWRERTREILSVVEKQGAEFRVEMRGLAKDFTASQKTNWPLVLGFITVFLSVVIGGGKLISLQTENTVAKALTDFGVASTAISNKLRADLDANTARDEVSIAERKKHDEEIRENRQQNETLKAQALVYNARLAEVETQFRASDQARNVQFSEQQRMNAIIWNAEHDAGMKMPTYPTAPFFHPSVAAPQPPN